MTAIAIERWNADVALTGLVALQGDQANNPLIDQLLSTTCLEPPKVGHSNQIRVLAVKKRRFLTSVDTGCATALDPGAEKVRIVSEAEKQGCESLGVVSTDQQLGLNKASNSMNRAVNEVARRGGNAMFLVTVGRSGIDGQAVTAEALRCKT